MSCIADGVPVERLRWRAKSWWLEKESSRLKGVASLMARLPPMVGCFDHFLFLFNLHARRRWPSNNLIFIFRTTVPCTGLGGLQLYHYRPYAWTLILDVKGIACLNHYTTSQEKIVHQHIIYSILESQNQSWASSTDWWVVILIQSDLWMSLIMTFPHQLGALQIYHHRENYFFIRITRKGIDSRSSKLAV